MHRKEGTRRDQAAATAGSAVIAGAVELMTAGITTRSQTKCFKTEQRAESEREWEKKCIQYFNLLRVSAQGLLDKITGLSEELPEKEGFWRRGRNQSPIPSAFTISANSRNGKEWGIPLHGEWLHCHISPTPEGRK